TVDLSFGELIDAVVRLLKSDGQWWVLLPPYEASQLAQQAEAKGLRPFRRLHLRHHADKPEFRIITGYSYGIEQLVDETLDIYERPAKLTDKPAYTDVFTTLLRPFYLIF